MDMIVCVKGVPHTQKVDLVIDPQKTDIKKDMLAHVSVQSHTFLRFSVLTRSDEPKRNIKIRRK